MRIHVYPADVGGCGYYRLIWPGEALRNAGADVTVIRPDEPAERQVQAIWWDQGNGDAEAVDVLAPDCDIIVLQRPLRDTLVSCIPRLQAKGVKVVVEVDDDFEALSPRNVSFRAVHPKHSPRRNWMWLREACQLADWVVVSTPTLAGIYGRHGRVTVVRNRVPRHYLDYVRPWHDGVFVGWSGSIETHPLDLQVTRGAVARAVESAGARFAVIGTGRGVREALGLREVPAASGWQEIDIYPQQLAELDVGIVPLELTRFNEAKSSLKMMEMAALGVPVVGSPTSENVRLHQSGVGLLASNPRQWEGMVRRLAGDVAAREELAGSSRWAMQAHTIEGHCEEWLAAWSSAVLVNSAR